jgi:hypothetical protein
MSALGHKRTGVRPRVMSVLLLKAVIRQREWHVRGDLTKGRIVCEGADAEPCKSFKSPFHLGIDQQDRIWADLNQLSQTPQRGRARAP